MWVDRDRAMGGTVDNHNINWAQAVFGNESMGVLILSCGCVVHVYFYTLGHVWRFPHPHVPDRLSRGPWSSLEYYPTQYNFPVQRFPIFKAPLHIEESSLVINSEAYPKCLYRMHKTPSDLKLACRHTHTHTRRKFLVDLLLNLTHACPTRSKNNGLSHTMGYC